MVLVFGFNNCIVIASGKFHVITQHFIKQKMKNYTHNFQK